MIYKHFKLSDEDGAMLEWDELINVQLRGDNLQQFEDDWNNMILNIRSLPEEAFLESCSESSWRNPSSLRMSWPFTNKTTPIEAKRSLMRS